MSRIHNIIALFVVFAVFSTTVGASHPGIVHCAASGNVSQWWGGASGPGTFPRQVLYYVQDDMWDNPTWWVALHEAVDEINIALDGRVEISLAREGSSGHDAALLPGMARFAETGNNADVNGASEIWFSENLYSPNLLAQESPWHNSVSNCYKSESNIRFDPTFPFVYWEPDSITLVTLKRDIAQVAVHELGHGLSLIHEWGKTSIMNNSYPMGGQAGNSHQRLFGALASKYTRGVYGSPPSYKDIAAKAWDLDVNAPGSNGIFDWTDSIKIKILPIPGGGELGAAPNNSIDKGAIVQFPYLIHNTSSNGGHNIILDFYLVTQSTNNEVFIGSKSVWAYNHDETKGNVNVIVPSSIPSGNHKWRYRIRQSDTDVTNNTVDLVHSVWIN